MKIAIYGHYQNSTEPIIKDIFVFLQKNNVELVIESFLEMLYEKKLYKVHTFLHIRIRPKFWHVD
jgi:NAD+ kinase